MLEEARCLYAADPELHRIVLNATSWVEANLAVELLSGEVPERALVTAANIREVIKELPRCPLAMAVDVETLGRIFGLERDGTGWQRTFADEAGEYTIVLLGEGNYCYDIVVRADERTLMWMPSNSEEDYLNPDVVDLIMERPTVLGNVVALAQAIGLPFYPTFYLSLEDWRQEYVQLAVDEVVSFLGDGEAARRRRQQDEVTTGTDVRFRGVSNESALSWLL